MSSQAAAASPTVRPRAPSLRAHRLSTRCASGSSPESVWRNKRLQPHNSNIRLKWARLTNQGSFNVVFVIYVTVSKRMNTIASTCTANVKKNVASRL